MVLLNDHLNIILKLVMEPDVDNTKPCISLDSLIGKGLMVQKIVCLILLIYLYFGAYQI